MEDKELLIAAIRKFGLVNQVLKACEEMAELSAVLLKDCNSSPGYPLDLSQHICEEIADVSIVLDQLKLIFDSDEINRQRMLKINRLKDLVNI